MKPTIIAVLLCISLSAFGRYDKLDCYVDFYTTDMRLSIEYATLLINVEDKLSNKLDYLLKNSLVFEGNMRRYILNYNESNSKVAQVLPSNSYRIYFTLDKYFDEIDVIAFSRNMIHAGSDQMSEGTIEPQYVVPLSYYSHFLTKEEHEQFLYLVAALLQFKLSESNYLESPNNQFLYHQDLLFDEYPIYKTIDFFYWLMLDGLVAYKFPIHGQNRLSYEEKGSYFQPTVKFTDSTGTEYSYPYSREIRGIALSLQFTPSIEELENAHDQRSLKLQIKNDFIGIIFDDIDHLIWSGDHFNNYFTGKDKVLWLDKNDIKKLENPMMNSFFEFAYFSEILKGVKFY
jgi:hypothetical protein